MLGGHSGACTHERALVTLSTAASTYDCSYAKLTNARTPFLRFDTVNELFVISDSLSGASVHSGLGGSLAS
jgi:hypothetical protein